MVWQRAMWGQRFARQKGSEGNEGKRYEEQRRKKKSHGQFLGAGYQPKQEQHGSSGFGRYNWAGSERVGGSAAVIDSAVEGLPRGLRALWHVTSSSEWMRSKREWSLAKAVE